MTVTVFVDKNFNGAGHPVGAGRYDLNTHAVGEDTISSIQIPPGWSVTVYSDLGLQGASATFTTDTGDLGGFNDTISSLIVEGPADRQFSAEADAITINITGGLTLLPIGPPEYMQQITSDIMKGRALG